MKLSANVKAPPPHDASDKPVVGSHRLRVSSATESLAEAIISTLASYGATLATCESLTGGLVAAALTEVPGASVVFRGGLVTYATDLKVRLAGVSEPTVAAGVVTRDTAIEMAIGARRNCGSDWAVATTGVAGPGPEGGVAVGTVWIAVVGPSIDPHEPLSVAEHHVFRGDRMTVRRAAVAEALSCLMHSMGG
mgnify:CR=1 FL=1